VNPFKAEMVVTHVALPPAVSSATRPPLIQLVARDSQGRVRFDRPVARYEVETGPDAGKQVEQHLIIICDPVSETLMQLDTLSKTATVKQSPPHGTQEAIQVRRGFCDSEIQLINTPTRQAVDLGHQIIEGVDARGIRITIQPLGVASSGVSPGETVQEKWCSDELSAVVLKPTENVKSGSKSSDAMEKLQRQEPDPSLFQIPADYTVADSLIDRQRLPTGLRNLSRGPTETATSNTPNQP